MPITYKFISDIPAVKVNSICRGNYWVTSMWILMQQVNYWSYILHSSNTWEKMGSQWGSASATYRLQEKASGSVRREILCNIYWVSYPHETGKANKNVCVNETYSRGWGGKNLSDIFPIRNCLKQRYALSPLFFTLAVEYSIRRVQETRMASN